MEKDTILPVDFTTYKQILDDNGLEYFESPNEISFKKRKSTAEGTLWLKLLLSANEKGEIYITVEGPGIEYTGYDQTEALTKFKIAKSFFDQG